MKSAAEAYRIILAEDDLALQHSVAEYLTRVGYSVTAVSNGLDFFRALGENTFNAAIIDLGLPDISGMRLVEYIQANNAMPCIIQTAHDLLEERVQGYETGADLYLIKPVDCRELASALGRLLRRKYATASKTVPNNHWNLKREHSSLIAPDLTPISLSFKEFAFICCLAADPQQPVPRQTILQSLGYSDDECSHRALESLVRRLRRKLDLSTGSIPIHTCHGIGYTFSAALRVE